MTKHGVSSGGNGGGKFEIAVKKIEMSDIMSSKVWTLNVMMEV